MTLEMLKKCEQIDIINYELHRLIVQVDDKKYLIERVGKCNPDRCKARCCKVISFSSGNNINRYWNGFRDFKISKKSIGINKNCRNLCKEKCKIWKTKQFPDECKEFPWASDGVYHASYKDCKFRYKICYEVKDDY